MQDIDKLLLPAGWKIQDYKELNLGASLGSAVPEFPSQSKFSNYLFSAYKDLVNVWHPDRFHDNLRLQQKGNENLRKVGIMRFSCRFMRSLNFFIFLALIYSSLLFIAPAYAQKDFSALYKKAAPSVVRINIYDKDGNQKGFGTGFFIKEDGILVTNYHVIKGGVRAEAKLSSGEVLPIEGIISEDEEGDLALLTLKVKGQSFPALKITQTKIEPGQPVVVIGTPSGFEGTVTDGIISAIREIRGFGRMIQITAPISPGSSGGPVLNMNGEIIGVIKGSFGGQNLNFAISVDRINRLLSHKQAKARELDESQRVQIPAQQKIITLPPNIIKQIEARKNLLKKNPKNLTVLIELGNLYFDSDQVEQAIKTYSRALAIDPKNADVRCDLGIMYRRKGNFDRAIEEFKKAAGDAPQHVNSRYNLGIVFLWDKGDLKAAINAFEDYLRLEPTGARAENIRNQLSKMKAMQK